MSNSNKNTNQSNTIKTSGTVGRSFGPGGCQAVTEGRKCGETNSLQIIQEFRRLYETKMKEIDEAAGGDCVQAKINLQQEWIRDLTDQNEMLVRVVEELEVEAAERVIMLEERLQQSAKCACEVMGFYESSFLNYIADSKNIKDIQSDLNNIIEVLKGAKQNRSLEFEGLTFNSINIKEILTDLNDVLWGRDSYSTENNAYDKDNIANEKMVKDKELKIKELEDKIKKLQETADKNEETRKTLQQYTELKKKMEEEQNTLLNKIKNLEAENEMMKEAILKAKKNLQKLEDKAENYLEERDDIKRKHRESLELIETLQKENMRSKETLQTLEDEKKAVADKIQNKVAKELEDYEKKHQECMKKLGSIRMELEKTKQENQASMAKIRTLSDQNKSQADEVASLKEKLEKLDNKSSTVSTGTTCKVCQKDAAVDSQSAKTKNVAVSNVPETRNTATLSDLEAQIIPVNKVHELNNAPYSAKTTDNKPASTYTVGKPPGIKKKETVKILEILEPATLDTYGCGMNAPPDAFDFVNTKYTATADSKSIKQLLQLEMIDSTNAVYDPTYKQNFRESEIPRDKKNVPITEKTEVLYNSKNMCQSSNESVPADYRYISNILDAGFSEIPPKTVRIDSQPVTFSTNNQNSDLSVKTSSESLMYQTALDTESKPVESEFQKKEVGQLEFVKKKFHIGKKDTHAPVTYRKSPPKRSTSPASTATEDLQNVVHDLNESVSRIIEKSPNEKATRQRITQLEEQLRLALKQREHDVENERRRRNKEVENLKLTINEMEKALQNKDANTVNLQSAVDLYLNSISVLEQSEERYQKEVNGQRITIVNLQEALVSTKHQLDELRVKYNKEVSSAWMSWFSST